MFPTDPYGPGFIYGKCEAGFDRGCAPPLQVQNHVDGGGVPTAPGPGPDCVLLKQVEGMPAVYAADALWLVTADTVVVLAGVPGSTPREYLRGAAADLRLIADGQTEPQPPDDAVAALYAAACG